MQHIADINDRLIQALDAQGYDPKWTYAKATPAEVVAEVHMALMHDRDVPRGLAALYVAYGGMCNATVDNTLGQIFGGAIPALNQPEDALAYIP